MVDTLDMMPYYNKFLCQPIHGILSNEQYDGALRTLQFPAFSHLMD